MRPPKIIRRLLQRRRTLKALGRTPLPPLRPIHGVALLGLCAAGIVLIAIGLSGSTSPPGNDPNGPIAHAHNAPPWLTAHSIGRLRLAVQDSAAVYTGKGSAIMLGGLDQAGASRPLADNISQGTDKQIGRLPTPLHDAAAGAIGRYVYLFGGGQAASYDSITRVDPATGKTAPAGKLPEPSSDLGAATVNATAYLVGGYTGSRPLDTILQWRPGAPARVVAHLPRPLRYAAVAASGRRIIIAGGTTGGSATKAILSFDPATGAVRRVGQLPHATTHAAAVAFAGDVYVIGGRKAPNGSAVRDIVAIDPASGAAHNAGSLPHPLSDAAAIGFPDRVLIAGGRSDAGAVDDLLGLAPASPTATPVGRSGLLRPGSEPGVLPGNVLIADRGNDRLIEVSPEGQIVWSFPVAGDLRKGQTFRVPDDAFYTRDGKSIVATQEDDYVISIINRGTGRISYRLGTPGVPGSTGNLLHNPDDAILLANGHMISADIKNCRLLEIVPPRAIIGQLGITRACYHDPPRAFTSPNGAFPTSDGGIVVTEINGDWIDVFDGKGQLAAVAHPPGFSYPSDTNEVRPGLYLSVDYAKPGAIAMFDAHGNERWRFQPGGADTLDHPSLALPLPGGDVLCNDDYNNRVIVVDPRTNRIVWQYGHTGAAGNEPGFLRIPDGVDLAPPHSLIDRFKRTGGLPAARP